MPSFISIFTPQSLGFVPMTVVLPWITHAFAGFLEAEQVR